MKCVRLVSSCGLEFSRNPNLAAKQKKSKAEELKDRPRFSSISRSTTALGRFKPQLWIRVKAYGGDQG